MPRPLFTRAAISVVCAGLLWTATPAHAEGPAHAASPERARPVSSAVWADRATRAYDALQHHLYEGPAQHGLYLEHTPGRPTTPRTPTSGRSARPRRQPSTCSTCRTPGPPTATTRRSGSTRPSSTSPLAARARGTSRILGPPLGTGGDIYYDDNAVVALSQLDQYEATGDPRLLERAERVVPVVARAWDGDGAKSCPGGMDWYDSRTTPSGPPT